MPTPLAEAIVAVTGASSGIGRAAALRFARRGARLALCARDPEWLAAAAAECEAAGATGVLSEALDVADEAALERLADAAVGRFGRLDVWVNDAGVIAYGDFLDIPADLFRRVVETNLIGQANGARVALRRFVPQRHGVLINMSSVWGRVSSPQVSAYVASKHAVRAFSESIRGEVAERPKREVTYGRAGRALEVLYALAPPATAGNVARPRGTHAVEGGWRHGRRGDLRRAFLAALRAGLRGRAGTTGLMDTQMVAPSPDPDAERKGTQRAEAAEERGEHARERARIAHEEAERAPDVESARLHEREAELHERAASLHDRARRLQEGHAREAAEEDEPRAADRES